MREYERQSDLMDQREEMVGDVFEGDAAEDDEVDAVTDQVFDEIGIEVASSMKSAPRHDPVAATRQRAPAAAADEDAELDAMIQKLGAV
jgi:charged multivesicular body protein 2A